MTALPGLENPTGLAPQGFDDVQRPRLQGRGRDVLAPPESLTIGRYKRLVYLVLGKSCLPASASYAFGGLPLGDC
ncbi:hypothetical protein EIB18_04860 [Caulobacter vibrioides]|uniref:Uncharacterized protein n=1 Tax=Caulobacter vibrioides (strain NA1000 / CB15N) TaxID=565050 RepID=A0A0H3C610_CAUVN|nr:hypothetical protein [Caulobacter vibrioides]YP_002516322.1 hypothetical protein CCNA_00949 [Caulobacter vibrioides NA1000]ACL94414.1 hypothetical protein CCNA_00949 [Caulobacter vibrioides NA1000]ATC23867.1 hypothetical protein CA608_04640 [Caulobacter vibrioides]ATC27741.1 hypothetical protein CA607_04800 [Caulobacter vibrioides]AZH12101.1 hypothetical protein EIB18_04860 [Caulobacter vibrioides]PLR15925.1 hypothetical protein CVUC_02155 [Caulobacter vibrioides]